MRTRPPAPLAARVLLCAVSLVCALVVLGALAIKAHFPRSDSAPIGASTNSPAGRPIVERVVLVLVDGLRHDTAFDPRAMPFLNQRRALGAWGIAQNPNLTLTNLAVINIGTGAPPQITKVLQNFKNSPVQKRSLFSLLHSSKRRIGFVGHTVWRELFGRDAELAVGHGDRGIEDLYDADDEALRVALPLVRARRFDFLVVHFHGVDHAGHKFKPRHEMYRKLAARIDGFIRQMHEADPRATMLVMADHGMTLAGTHGGGEPDCANVPFVFFGPGIAPASNIRATLSDFAPTLLAMFGIPDLGSAEGHLLVEALALPPAAAFALWQRYLRARMRYLKALAEREGKRGPPTAALERALRAVSAGDLTAALAAARRQAHDLVRYTRDVLESTRLLRWLEYALVLLLAASALLWVRRFGDERLALPGALRASAISLALLAVIAALLRQEIVAALLAYLQLAALAVHLVLRETSESGPSRRRLDRSLAAHALALPVALGIALFGAAELYRVYLAEHGITGWTVFLPALDRWYMPRLQGLFALVAGISLALYASRAFGRRALPDPSAVGGGVLIAIAMILGVFYWEGNNMARLALLIAIYAAIAHVRVVRQQRRWFSPRMWALALIALGLWQIGYRARALAIEFQHTYPVWHGVGIALLALYLAWIARRLQGRTNRATVASVTAGLAALLCAYLFRYTQAQPLVYATLAVAALSVVALPLGVPRTLRATILPVALLGVYRMLSNDVQMVVIVLAAAALAAWTELVERGDAPRDPLITGLFLVCWNLLVFFASGYFWNFSSVEVVIAFIGRPDEIQLAWAISLIMLKYGIPWMLLVASFFAARFAEVREIATAEPSADARRPAASASRPTTREPAQWDALVAVGFCYVCMIAGLLLPFDTLKTHIEFGSKALPTAVFSYVHSGLFVVAIALLIAIFAPRGNTPATSRVL